MLIFNSGIWENNFPIVCKECLIFRLLCDMEERVEMCLNFENQHPFLMCSLLPCCKNITFFAIHELKFRKRWRVDKKTQKV